MRKMIHWLFVATLLCSLSIHSVYAQSGGSYTLELQAGELVSKLPTNKNEVRDLTLKGMLNSSDLSVLRTLPQIDRLNLQAVTITIGGCGYTSNYFPSQTLQVEQENTLPKALFADMKTLKSLTLPTTLVAIGDYALRGSGITYLQVPSSTTTLGERAFAHCTALKKVKLHKNISKLPKGIFEGCTALTAVQGIKVSEVADDAFNGCASLVFTLSGGVTRIGDNAFRGCTSLQIAYLSNTVTYLGSHAFDGCSSLSMIFIKGRISAMGEYVFANCPHLVNVHTPYDQKELPKGTFAQCSALKEIWLGSSMTQIGALAFENCQALTTLRIDNLSVPTIDATAFNGVSCDKVDLFVPYGKSTLYKANAKWAEFQIKELALTDNGVNVVTIHQKTGETKALKVGFRSTLPITFDLNNGKLIKKAPGSYSSSKSQINCTNGGKKIDILSMPSGLRSFIVNDPDGNNIENITFNTPELDYLWLASSQITSLNLSKVPKLRLLNIYGNERLETLDLSHNPELTFLDVSIDEKLKKIDLSANPKLTTLKASMTHLATWDFTQTPLLKELDLNMTTIKKLDLSPLTHLESLLVAECKLEELIFPTSANLKEIFINDNLLSAEQLNAIFNALPQRDIADEAKIYIKGNPGASDSNTDLLKSKNWTVDVEGSGSGGSIFSEAYIAFCTKNKTLSFHVTSGKDETLSIDWGDGSSVENASVSQGIPKNFKHTFVSSVPQHEVKIYSSNITTLGSAIFNLLGLTYLDVTHCPTLQVLSIPNGNDLLSVDLSKNNELTRVDLAGCNLSSIILPKNGSKLRELKLSTNEIKELNLKGLTALEILSAPSNKLKKIDLTDCRKLKKINLNLNGLEAVIGIKDLIELTELDIANNTLPFSMLPAKKKMTKYLYSQYWYDIPTELIDGYTIDLSREFMVQGITEQPEQTTFKWYIQKDIAEHIEVPVEAYTMDKGKFTFNNKLFPQGSSKVEIFVLMTNPSFPEINTKSKGLRSGFITIKRIQSEQIDPSKFDKKLEGLYENAFAGSKNLIEIKLPKNTKEIRDKAFYHCPQLNSVEVTAAVETLSSKAFEDKEGLIIYVPTEAIKAQFEKVGKFQKTKVVVGSIPETVGKVTEGKPYSIAIEGHTLVLTSQTTIPQSVALYDLKGQALAHGVLSSGSVLRMALPHNGFYVIVINNEVFKVFIS